MILIVTVSNNSHSVSQYFGFFVRTFSFWLMYDVIVYEKFDCFDITPNGITKKSGIDKLAKMLNVLPEEMIAVGDGINDYPMFEYAGIVISVIANLVVVCKSN